MHDNNCLLIDEILLIDIAALVICAEFDTLLYRVIDSIIQNSPHTGNSARRNLFSVCNLFRNRVGVLHDSTDNN